jgi:putative FmdB family regulatory protein
VTAVVGTAERAEAVRRPGDDVRGPGQYLLAAAGAQVGLRRRRPCHRLHMPVAVGVPLEPPAAVADPRLEVVHARVRGRADTTTTRTVAARHDTSVGGGAHNGPSRPTHSATRRGPVPRYDVRCRACGTTFEVNRQMARADEPAPCPHGHDDTVRLLPTVGLTGRAGTATATAPTAGTGGGCCGGGCCG